MTVIVILIFLGVVGLGITLETASHVGGIVGVISALFFGFMTYRKKLLNAGFTAFSNQYRIEMDEFKKEVFRYINTLRGLMNEREISHSKTLEAIVELNLQTQKQVAKQIGACQIIQGKKDVITKSERDWKKNIEEKTNETYKDVEQIKDEVSYLRGILNGKKK